MDPIAADCESWIGSIVLDADGVRVGTIESIYFDEQTDCPQWMVVRTGLFGVKHSFVPLADATLVVGAVRTPHDKRQIERAPKVDDADDVPDEQVVELYRYYGLPYAAPVDQPPRPGESLTERVLRYVG